MFIAPYVLLAVLLLVVSTAVAASSWDPFTELAASQDWDLLKPGEARMFAGTDPGGANVDSGNFLRIEPDGASFQEGDWVLAEMEGPGCITRIWVTGKSKDNKGPRIYGGIKIFVDSKDTPVIDLPIEEFFGRVDPFIPPLATPTSGGFVSYVPIPFSRYCKVVVTDHQDRYAHRVNGLKQTIPHLYHHVCWRKLPANAQVEPFSLQLSDERKALLKSAANAFQPKPVSVDVKTQEVLPGQKISVCDAGGSGRIEEFVLVSPDPDDLWVSMYWDDSDLPAVDVPAQHFFAAGLKPERFSSLPFASDGTTSVCRFPMPYERGARIVLENRGGKPVVAGASVSIGPYVEPISGVRLRFHACYIDAELPAGSPDLVLLDEQQGPGQFVGAALTLPHAFLEGNESFAADSDDPQWVGTGTEDYFSGGWYFCYGIYDQALSGCTSKGDYVSAYRFHLLDAVPFARTLRATLEHGGHNEVEGRARGVVYWYRI